MSSPFVGLGALTSEINEPDALPDEFASLLAVTENVVAAIRAGRLGAGEGAELLRGLRIQGEDGFFWCVGASSFRWYRKENEGPWRFGIPPSVGSELYQQSLNAALTGVPAEFLGTVEVVAGGYGEAEESPGVSGLDPWAQAPGGERQSWGSLGASD